jgi:hypothetical protein
MFFSEIGALQGLIVPDPSKPLTRDSLVDQYKDQAIRACRAKGWDETSWRALAEIWAHTDLDIIDDVCSANPGKSDREVLAILGVRVSDVP